MDINLCFTCSEGFSVLFFQFMEWLPVEDRETSGIMSSLESHKGLGAYDTQFLWLEPQTSSMYIVLHVPEGAEARVLIGR